MGVNSSPKTVTRQRRGCDLNPGLLRLRLALTHRLPSHPVSVSVLVVKAETHEPKVTEFEHNYFTMHATVD